MNKAREVSSHEMAESAQRLTSTALSAADASGNEANLRHELELSLRSECLTLGIPYIPYQLEYALRGGRKHTAFADVVHGGVIIEYEPPKSFSAGRAKANIQHAKEQVEDYAARMAQDEGRPIEDYVLAIWDGTHIAFGTTDGATAKWEPLVAFDVRQGARSQTLITSRLAGEANGHGIPPRVPATLRSFAGIERWRRQAGRPYTPSLALPGLTRLPSFE